MKWYSVSKIFFFLKEQFSKYFYTLASLGTNSIYILNMDISPQNFHKYLCLKEEKISLSVSALVVSLLHTF